MELIQALENTMRKQLIRSLVSSTMFCPYSEAILDMRTCIMIDIEDKDGKTVLTQVISPSLVDKLPEIKKNVLGVNPTHVVKFYSSNKAFKTNDLITLI